MEIISLLLIDDFASDQLLERVLIESAFDNVRVTTVTAPPAPLAGVLTYDGIIIDEKLGGGVSGSIVAQDINALDWLKPTMLLTGLPSRQVATAMRYVDQIACKTDQLDMLMKLTAFVRGCARCKS